MNEIRKQYLSLKQAIEDLRDRCPHTSRTESFYYQKVICDDCGKWLSGLRDSPEVESGDTLV
ncbi:MAG: hypothetical protein ACXABY_10575 [Candidatus Thorarchaeota archaeon]|jgi:hypothetical protein